MILRVVVRSVLHAVVMLVAGSVHRAVIVLFSLTMVVLCLGRRGGMLMRGLWRRFGLLRTITVVRCLR